MCGSGGFIGGGIGQSTNRGSSTSERNPEHSFSRAFVRVVCPASELGTRYSRVIGKPPRIDKIRVARPPETIAEVSGMASRTFARKSCMMVRKPGWELKVDLKIRLGEVVYCLTGVRN